MCEIVEFKNPECPPQQSAVENGDRYLFSTAAQVVALLPLETPSKCLKILTIAVGIVTHLGGAPPV